MMLIFIDKKVKSKEKEVKKGEKFNKDKLLQDKKVIYLVFEILSIKSE